MKSQKAQSETSILPIILLIVVIIVSIIIYISVNGGLGTVLEKLFG